MIKRSDFQKMALVLALSCGWLFARSTSAGVLAPAEPPWDAIAQTLKNRALRLDWHDASGNSLVFYHLHFGYEADAVRLIQLARAQRVSIQDRDTLAYFSAANGKEYALKELITSGTSPSATFAGESLLMVAAREERLGIIRTLIAAGADVNYSWRPQSNPQRFADAFTYALEAGKYNAARLLLGAGFDIARNGREHVNELLFSAIAGGSTQAVSYLLDNAISISAVSSGGETPLTFAIQNEASDAVISELLLRGADLCQRNKAGDSVEELLAKVNKDKQSWDQRYAGLRDRLVCIRNAAPR